MPTFKDRLKELRLFSSITQVDMAKGLELARQTYLDIETGKTPPRLDTIEGIAKLLNVDACYLAFGRTAPSQGKREEIKQMLKLIDRYVSVPMP